MFYNKYETIVMCFGNPGLNTLSVSESKAYSVVRQLNKELSDKGYMVIPGRVSKKYFEERFYGIEKPGREETYYRCSL